MLGKDVLCFAVACKEGPQCPLCVVCFVFFFSLFCSGNLSSNMKCHSQNQVVSLGWWQQLELQNS